MECGFNILNNGMWNGKYLNNPYPPPTNLPTPTLLTYTSTPQTISILDLWFRIFGLGLLVSDVWRGILGLGNCAPEAGGSAWQFPGTLRPELIMNTSQKSSEWKRQALENDWDSSNVFSSTSLSDQSLHAIRYDNLSISNQSIFRDGLS